MKVELGGGVVETVVVEVTNLILNKASAIFRGIIGKHLPTQLTSYLQPLQILLVYLEKMSNCIMIRLITRI